MAIPTIKFENITLNMFNAIIQATLRKCSVSQDIPMTHTPNTLVTDDTSST